VLVVGGVLGWLVENNTGSNIRLLDLGGDVFDCERECDDRVEIPGVGGDTSS
jgi:hypothetical protein